MHWTNFIHIIINSGDVTRVKNNALFLLFTVATLYVIVIVLISNSMASQKH